MLVSASILVLGYPETRVAVKPPNLHPYLVAGCWHHHNIVPVPPSAVVLGFRGQLPAPRLWYSVLVMAHIVLKNGRNARHPGPAQLPARIRRPLNELAEIHAPGPPTLTRGERELIDSIGLKRPDTGDRLGYVNFRPPTEMS